ncbi:unnamed protein product [Hyaloperonospora brassicae]|uniref:RxLR effector candidate protein n=1 Tax=Hyaloperonospora brassicae TaxID=162125 RepID=A0AAV0T355_HYABA|nr:unnamed protein product [Hyaloperonospora brassicae]
MRVFTLALVASSALLPRPDGVSEAADPAPMEHQDPAVAVLAAGGENSPPSRVLRSQGTMATENSESIESRPFSPAEWISELEEKFEKAFKALQEHQPPKRMHEVLEIPDVETVAYRFGDDAIRKALRNEDDTQRALLLYELRSSYNEFHKSAGKTLLKLLMNLWIADGKTPLDVMKLLGLHLLSDLSSFTSQHKHAVGVLWEFCEASAKDPKRGEAVYRDTVETGYGGREGFDRAAMSTGKPQAFYRLFHLN